jgi:hypothetical protein
VIQSFIIKTFPLLAIALLAASCSTTDSQPVTEQSAPASVPGEKVVGDNQVMPSATSGVPSASIGW